jgi:hypothetical protein
MILWIIIIISSAFIGLICAYLFKGRVGVVLAGLIPWSSILAWLLYQEYIVPYKGGGASMWPIALLFVGTVAAATGIFVYLWGKKILKSII